MSETPKPCPFCGRIVEIRFKRGDLGYTHNTVAIRCPDCRIGFVEDAERWEQGKGTFSIREEAEEKLLKKWNQRA